MLVDSDTTEDEDKETQSMVQRLMHYCRHYRTEGNQLKQIIGIEEKRKEGRGEKASLTRLGPCL